jgi:hypothetical protein
MIMPGRKKDNPKTLKRKADSPMAVALRAEIKRLVETEPFTLGTMRAIGRVAELGRQILTGEAELDALLPEFGNNSISLSGTPSIGDYLEPVEPIGFDGGLMDGENMGTRATREFMGLIPKVLEAQKKPRMVETVRALAIARKEGLDDIAEQLMEQLKPQPEPIDSGMAAGMRAGLKAAGLDDGGAA